MPSRPFRNMVAPVNLYVGSAASTGAVVQTSTVAAALTGFTLPFTATSGATYLAILTADVQVNTTGTTNIVELLFDAGALAPQILTAGPNGLRHTLCQTFILTPAVGSHTITAQTRNAAGGGSFTVNPTHTRVVVTRVA